MMSFWGSLWGFFESLLIHPSSWVKTFGLMDPSDTPNKLVWTLALIPISVGLASSVTHCAGMCAPIHFFIASKKGRGVFSYHAGRITTYGLLGMMAGLAGQGLYRSASAGSLARITATILAVLYLMMALHWFGVLSFGSWLEKGLGHWLAKPATSMLPRFQKAQRTSQPSLFLAGLAGGLLPCPTTQAMLLLAIGTGRPSLGFAVMTTMGIGTLPIFIALRPKWAMGPQRRARAFATVLGLLFVALAVQKVHGAWFLATPTCH